MTDEASFLAAIAENPKDTNLPLIFADWLDDHGDPRGQWIRHWSVAEWMRPTYENPIPKLLQALAKDKRVMAVRRAAEVIGEPLVPGLIELLAHERPRVRQQACHCLRNIGPRARAAADALMKALGDSDYSVREQAAKALATIGTDETANTDQLKAALTDENWSVRRTASKVLGAMGAKGSVLEELVERYESPDVKDRTGVIEGLAQLGTAEAIPHLDKALDDPDGTVRVAAIQALGGSKSVAAVGPLCRAMRTGDAAAREAAAQQFTGYGRDLPRPPEVIEALIALLSDRANVVRATACSALERTGHVARAAVPALLKNLTHDVAQVRSNAAQALAHVVRDDPAVNAALTNLIADPELTVAHTAVAGLALQTVLGYEVIEPLFAFVRRVRADEGNAYCISSAYSAFGRLDAPPPAVIDELRRALVTQPQQYYHDLAWDAAQALAHFGPAAAPAVPELVAALRANRATSNAARALVVAGPTGAGALAALFADPDERLRSNVIDALWQIGKAGAPLVPALLECLDRSTNDWMRARVIYALQTIGATEAIPVFIREARTGDYHSTAAAFRALSAFRSELVPHLPALVQLERDPTRTQYLGTCAELFVALATYTPDVLDPLRAVLRDAQPSAADDWNARWSKKGRREHALRGFAVLRTCGHVSDDVVAPLVAEIAPFVEDPEVEVRRLAVTALSSFSVPAVAAALCRALADTDDLVRLRAADALASVGDTADETLAALVHTVSDRVPKVRRAAVDALNKLKASTDAVRAALEEATRDDDAKVAERARIALKKASAEPKPKTSRANRRKQAE